jgi:hypothetical protein
MTDILKPAFIEGMCRLIQQLITRLAEGERFDNPKFTALADESFGGTRAQGLYTCRDAYDALEAAVNRYLLESKARPLMQAEAEPFATLRALLEQVPTQTDRTAEQTELQQFSTPPTIAFLAAKLLAPQAEDVVLEPSAGTGSLAIWPRALGARVVCNEISARRGALLETFGFETYNVDAEMIHDVLPDAVQPTAVLMNPPFSATGGRVMQHHSKYGLLHVESALRRLQEGGRLVAILGESVSFHRPAMTPWWENLMTQYTVRANLGLDGREYAKYGTANDVQLIVIDKVGPTAGKGWKSKLSGIIWGSAASVEEAWSSLEKLPPRANRQPEAAIGAGPKASTPLFVPYVPAKLTGGSPHPAMIVESASMAAVVPPDITYRPHLPSEIVKEGKLSIIQLERVIYAGQRHEQRLPDESRAGFYVGDGTGVGKGRTLAAIILDNWFQNRRRAVWFSVNNDLLDSTRRDLNDLGVDIPLAKINDDPAAGDISLRRGVIFSSYGSLIASAKNGARRLDQIQRWLGSDGVIIFDEAHKAKNALAGGRGEPTLTGQAVIDLQDATHNPDYRVVYSSATGATDVRNMAYMTRLGLWGKGTSFPDGFKDFMEDIDGGGVGAMEMVSRDMKSLGMYLSGSISFGVCPTSGKAVEYREVIHRLTEEQRSMYNHASQAWKAVFQNIEKALDITNASPRARGRALTKFWGDHQRFFRQIICSFKVPTVITEAEAALAQEKSVVISLVGTGEARTKDQVARAIAEGGSLEDLDFSPREIIGKLIERGFPTALYRDETDPVSKRIIKVLATDNEGHPIQSKEALKLRQKLLDGLSALQLPENPLDQLVNHFGEFSVSEITGRSRRLIRDKRTGETHYKKRAPEGVAMNRVNVHGMEQFQAGNTRMAIISDAGSIGISLHASNRGTNRQRRVHITHELGWSADKQMQCFGRTHRSDQAVPPEYVLLSTELGGEKRFSSTIARRLGSLGALTKGDRGAADNADWARYNFETEQGKAALSLLFRRISTEAAPVPGLLDPKQTLRDIGLLICRDGREEVRDEDLRNVPRFLNRILALGVEDQNALFDYFAELFDQTVSYAKANGTFDAGVTDIRALAIRIAKPPRVVHADRVTGAETILYPLQVDRWSNRIDFEQADRVRAAHNGTFLRHQKGNFVLAVPSGRHTNPEKGSTYLTFALWKPEGPRSDYISESDVAALYVPVPPNRVRTWWDSAYQRAPLVDTEEINIIGGAIIPLWERLKAHRDSKLRVLRVGTDDGKRIVGIEIPRRRLGAVLRAIGIGKTVTDPQEIFTAVLEQGDEIELVSKMNLKLATHAQSPAIELECSDPARFPEFRDLGLINEQIKWKQRFFVPMDKTKGLAVLSALLTRYPVLPRQEQPAESLPIKAEADQGAARKVVLEDWVLPAEQNVSDIVVDSGSQMEMTQPLVSIEAVPEVLPFVAPVVDDSESAHLTAPVVRNTGRKSPPVPEQGLLFSLN